MESYEEMGNNSVNNAMSMTATDIVESLMMHEYTSLRYSLHMKVRIIDSNFDSKSMSQLRKDNIKRRKGSPYILDAHLQLKDPEVCQGIPLLKDTDQSSVVTPNDGNRVYCNYQSVEPI